MAKQPQSARDLFWNVLFNRKWQHTMEEGLLADATKVVFGSVFNTFLEQPLKAVRVMVQIAEVIDYDASKAIVGNTWNQDNCPTFKVLKALSDELNQPIRIIMDTPNGKVRLESPRQAMSRLTESLGDSPALGGRDGVWTWFERLNNPQRQETATSTKSAQKKRGRGKKKPRKLGNDMASLEGCLDTLHDEDPPLVPQTEAQDIPDNVTVVQGVLVMHDNTADGDSQVVN